MSIGAWILNYLMLSLVYKWILSWGGAERIEGWLAGFFIDWIYSVFFKVEQIRLYILFAWICSTLIFIAGLFQPNFRF